MAYRVRIQDTALKELDGIVAYLTTCGPQAARSFLDEWEASLGRLRDGTVKHRLARLKPLADAGYHSFLVRGYIALYYIENDSVVIAHIFHQSQDYAKLV